MSEDEDELESEDEQKFCLDQVSDLSASSRKFCVFQIIGADEVGSEVVDCCQYCSCLGAVCVVVRILCIR